jgi:MerR family transcriptional regulator, light-induced transcriptional regulator
MIEEAAAHVEPDLVVVTAALPERFADIAGDLAGLGRRRATAIAGRGASAALAAAAGARHLDGDPVSAAHDLSVRR